MTIRLLGFIALFLSRSSIGFAQEDTATTVVYGPQVQWVTEAQKEIGDLEKAYPNQIGVYIKRSSDQTFVSHRGEELFYLASGVKLPVAIEVLRQIDEKKLSLETQLALANEDNVESLGNTNLRKAGSELSIQFLLEQMLIYNDNTANDLLIKRVGIDPINTYLKELVPAGFEKITSNVEVLRAVYSEIHPSTKTLTPKDLRDLNIEDDKQRLAKVREILKLKESDLACPDFSIAYKRYFDTHLNSGTLKAYTHLLEQISIENVLSDSSKAILLDMMKKSDAGQRLLLQGLPKDVEFAHKTGSLRNRICDFGIAWKGNKPTKNNSVILAMCVREYQSAELAAAAFRKIADTLVLAKIFEYKPVEPGPNL